MLESQRLWGMNVEVGVNRQSHVGRVAVFAAKRKMASRLTRAQARALIGQLGVKTAVCSMM